MTMKLYGFFRSGTSHRLRIALALKNLPFETVPVDLRKDEHLGEAFRQINPQALVPALVDDSLVLTQSPALLEWLEETHPSPALLPTDAVSRARVRALAAIVGCDIHPINNRRILNQLRASFGANEAAINAWCGQWIRDGFDAYAALLADAPEYREQLAHLVVVGETPPEVDALAGVAGAPRAEAAPPGLERRIEIGDFAGQIGRAHV